MKKQVGITPSPISNLVFVLVQLFVVLGLITGVLWMVKLLLKVVGVL